MPQIRLDGVSICYKKDKALFSAVNDISFAVEKGEFLFLTGSSGAGKSTIINALTGNIRPTSGKIFLDDANAKFLSARAKAKRKIRFGFVPQESHLVRRQTIYENLEPFAHLAKRKDASIEQLINKAIALVGLDDVKGRYPAELSHGECRRAELARAILTMPTILVLDEITANIDDDTLWDMYYLLSELNSHGVTIIMATHSKKLVDIARRRVITLVDGKIFSDVKKGKYGTTK